MKKLTLSLIMIVAVLFITACVQPVSEVDTFTLSGWTMKDYYDIGDEDALWADGVTLNVVYRDGTSESLDLDSSVNDGTVTLTGDYNDDPLGLETGAKGYYSVTITIDNVSLSFSYYVFDLDFARFVGESETYEKITDALTGADDGTTIFVENGTYEESVDIDGLSDITIFGESEEYVIIDSSNSSSRALFATGANNLSLINLTFTDDYSVGGGSGKRFMVKLQTGTDNVTVRNVTIEGPGQEFINESDLELLDGSPVLYKQQAVGGLDLNGIVGALIENVTVTDISRNALALSNVENARILDMDLQRAGIMGSFWSAVALYETTTLIEITGSIDHSNIGINYSSPPYADFEYGNIAISNTLYPLSLSDTGDRDLERSFALNVTGMAWEVAITNFFSEENVLVYFSTEAEANSFVSYLEEESVEEVFVDAEGEPLSTMTFKISDYYEETVIANILD